MQLHVNIVVILIKSFLLLTKNFYIILAPVLRDFSLFQFGTLLLGAYAHFCLKSWLYKNAVSVHQT